MFPVFHNHDSESHTFGMQPVVNLHLFKSLYVFWLNVCHHHYVLFLLLPACHPASCHCCFVKGMLLHVDRLVLKHSNIVLCGSWGQLNAAYWTCLWYESCYRAAGWKCTIIMQIEQSLYIDACRPPTSLKIVAVSVDWRLAVHQSLRSILVIINVGYFLVKVLVIS